MQAVGYWYRKGKLFDVGVKKHIDYIIQFPEKFDFTKEEIKDIYDSYNEKMGVEGKAREFLIKEVIKDGWIRIRHYVKPNDYWSIQYDTFRLRKRDLKNLVEVLMLDEQVMQKDDELVFMGFEDGSKYIYSYMNGGASKFLTENKKCTYKKIHLVESFENM